jgi:alpha-1,3-rhamnosyl/mannosyltransferase
MKVILSLDPVRFPLTGIGRYTYELALNLQKNHYVEQLRFFSGYQFVNGIPEPIKTSKSPRSSVLTVRQAILKIPFVADMYRSAASVRKFNALRGHGDYIFHGPNFYLPSFEGRMVCTFHDLSVFTWSHCHPSERIRYMRKEIALTLKRANMLITDSEYTRQEVASFFSWPLERIRSVPLACSADFYPRTSDELTMCLERRSLKFLGYSLYVGTIEPRKNLDALLDAYALLPIPLRQKWPLVIIGYRGWRSEQLHMRIKAAMAEGWVRYLGFVSAGELPLIYAGARLFIFPSLYEGFGLPILEAMASGVPVVCSNASTLPEVAGGAAAMCAPGDVDLLSHLIARGLEDMTWRAEARRKGLVRAADFSWQRCAAETAAVYREVSL